jgi:hypothetical protein
MTLDIIYKLVTMLAIVLAGFWTLFRFGISREQYPKLQFNLSMNQLGMSRDKRIVEFVAVISNKGIARQKIHNFTFNILTFDDNLPFDISDPKIEKRLRFHEFDKGLNWVNSQHDAFVDGGTSQEFTYVTALDKEVRFVMIYSKFDHEHKRKLMPDTSEHYRIAKTFALG